MTVVEAPWEDLPEHVDDGFDAVLCAGGSLGHAPDRQARRAALRAFATVLTDGGVVVLDGQDWDAVRSAGDQVVVDPLVVERDGLRCTRSFRWQGPVEPAGAFHLTVEMAFDDGDGASRTSRHTVVLQPYTPAELADDLRATGFSPDPPVQVPGVDRWSVTARRQARGSSPSPTSTS